MFYVQKQAENCCSRQERAEQTRRSETRVRERAADTIRALRAVNVRSFQGNQSVFSAVEGFISAIFHHACGL